MNNQGVDIILNIQRYIFVSLERNSSKRIVRLLERLTARGEDTASRRDDAPFLLAIASVCDSRRLESTSRRVQQRGTRFNIGGTIARVVKYSPFSGFYDRIGGFDKFFFFFFPPTRQSPRCLASVIRQYRRAPCSTLRVIVFSGEKIKVDVKIARHFVIFTADDHGILRRSAALVYEHTRAYASEGKRAQVDNTEDFRRYTAILASSP